MLHDELLAVINKLDRIFLDKILANNYGISALRAVAKLHTPDPHPCSCCDPIWCACGHKIPCPTILAIEAELE